MLCQHACGRTRRPSAFPRMLSHVVCMMLVHFLAVFAQGQGPGGVIQMSVLEESSVGTEVGQVAVTPGLQYSLQDASPYFTVSPAGLVTTKADIDRETLDNPVIQFMVIGVDPNGGSTRIVHNIAVTVEDINDNPPQFRLDGGATTEKISFQEDATEGRKNILTATDPDAGLNGEIGDYRIVAGDDSEMFGLDFSGLPLILYIYKKGSESFDHEKRDRYQLTIAATDKGTPSAMTGTVLVDVLILDVNDNTPAFDLSEYKTQVNESAPVGTSVFRAEATDDDDGFNGEIIYRIEDASNQFRIDENTGVIETITSPLTCSRRCGKSSIDCNPNSCFLLVEASDKGLVALRGRAYVYIEVLDENNHDPVIRFTKHDSEITVATVDENAARTTVVFTISVTDEDKGDNGKTSLSILRGNEEGYFYHMSVPSLGINEVQVAKQLDREAVGRFNLTLEARDHGTPQRSSTANIVILVNDANDHKPEFERSDYRASLSELAKPHSFVASIRATDNDEGINSKITYEIVSGKDAPPWFAIDADTGLVTTIAKVDHEESYQVVLNISARDGGAEPKYNHALLTVDIEDENDYVPTFTQLSYNQELNENEPEGSEIVVLKTRDLDSGDNGTVEYILHPDTELRYPGVFSIDVNSGKLTTTNQFDREVQDKYVIKVVAHDNGPNPLSSTATVGLTITDENDNKPRFSPKEYYVNLQLTDPSGMQVIRVQAYDEDIGEFGRITYTLSDPSNSFRINSNSGVISNTRTLLRQTYRMTVSAVDGGGSSSETDAEVNVIVISQSSVAPEFTERAYTFQITEDNQELQPQVDRFVGNVAASSRAGRNVSFAITAGDPRGVFKIGKHSGSIRTQLAVDREVTSTYTLTVIAYDGEKISSTKVIVNVRDQNDNSPKFRTHTTEVIVPENWPVGHNIFLAQAYDKDGGSNREVSYSLRSARSNGQDDSNGVFAINTTTGVIYLAKPPDEMPGTSASLTVTATDSGSPSRSTSMTISVRVADVNDHTPIFSQNRFELFLRETQAVNEIVKVMSATDKDSGPNGELTYSIIRGNEDDRFGIFPDGSLYLAHVLDRERKDMYSLTVVATDNSVDDPRRSTVNVTVYVQDANDNAPKFTENVFEFDIMENSEAGTFVGMVKANDADIGRNSEIVYSLGEGKSNFSIDPIMGTLFSRRSFDREYMIKTRTVPYFMIDVYATDNGLNKRQTLAKVKVNVKDENDSPPVFTHAPDAMVAVYENVQVNDVIFTLQAVDADAGPNAAVSYSIVSGNDAGKFGINAGTGKLFLKATLDRERQDLYLLTFKATDTGSVTSLSATTSLNVYVMDFNDNAPRFVDNTPGVMEVSETALVGQTIAQFSGTDRDMGNNGKLRYDIVSGNDGDVFALDKYSGKLTLARTLDHETFNHGEHTLNITLSDSGFPALQTSKLLNVIVLDANDNTPYFVDGLSKVHINEGSEPVGTVIAFVSANDRDSGDLSKVRYKIYKESPTSPANGPERFTINAINGEILLQTPLDKETGESYDLVIHAEDQDPDFQTRRTAEKTLTIVVTDINDNSPKFQSPAVFLVPYPSSRGGEVATLLATDLDSGKNGKVTYSMSATPPGLFALDTDTGRITLGQALPSSPMTYTATVSATDGGRLGEVKSTSMSVTFLLYTSTGNGPTFSSGFPSPGTVLEETPRNTRIMTMRASPSSTDLTVEYYVTGVTTSGSGSGRSYGGLFTIGQDNGELVTAASIDRDVLETDTFLVDITAVEGQGSNQRATTQQVTVVIQDDNDNPPVFSSSVFDVTVSEDASLGSSVAWVLVSDPDTRGVLSLSLTGPEASMFRIEQDGTVRTNQALDYETRQRHLLTVFATDGDHTATAQLDIHVRDENDHDPEFVQPEYFFEVSEAARPGYTIGSVKATDVDSGKNGRIVYGLDSEWGQEFFLLDAVHGSFTLVKELDFEERQVFTLSVIARDEGTSQRSTEVKVYMNVKDANDNEPVFDPMTYYIEIPEDSSVGTPLVDVNATDIDSGLNGIVRYSIVEGPSPALFGIGPINGSLYTKGDLDREFTPIYRVLVKAMDQAPNVRDRMTTTATVEVRLRDVNDSPPVFLTPPTIHIPETASVGTTVYTIQAEDADQADTPNSRVQYTLVSQSQRLPPTFSLEADTGALVLLVQLDRETLSNHSLVIRAKDGISDASGSTSSSAYPPHITELRLQVIVDDANDNAPEFTSPEYRYTVSEDEAVGTSLLRVLADDRDQGFNGAVRYFIVGGEGSHDFHLDATSGVLRIQKALDFERASNYSLQVQALDSSVDAPSLSANATVVITVLDINDFVPVFDDSPYHTFVQEGMPDGPVPVMTVSARDEDSGMNGRLQYSLRKVSSSMNFFRVGQLTGEITVLRSLDRETTPMYVLTIVAIDNGSPKQSGTGTVTLFVKDVNDHSPVFESSGPYLARVTENQAPGTEVVTVSATDMDQGDNSQIIYSLEDSIGNRFTVHPSSGKVTTTVPLDRELESRYELVVIATDQGIPPRSASVEVKVIVEDDNDHAPEFGTSSYTATMYDSSNTADFVVGVTAVDQDSGNNGKVHYTLEGPDKIFFHVNSGTGVITHAGRVALIQKQRTTFTFTVRASDLGANPLNSTASVVVTLSSASTADRPSFSDFQEHKVKENAQAGTPVTTVTALSSSGSGVTYHIAGGNINNAFSVNDDTGSIIVANRIDYEVTNMFELWLEARDKGGTHLSTFQKLMIPVEDENDNPPIFVQNIFTKDLKENCPRDTSVIKVMANDQDSGSNSQLAYSIKSGNTKNTFTINRTTGIITTNTDEVDREDIAFYNLEVMAVDLGVPDNSATATVRVTILDENDNEPTFTGPRSVAVPEDLPIGAQVMKLHTQDADIGVNARAHFSLEGGTPGAAHPFIINSVTGVITTVASLDAEIKERYSLQVNVEDDSFSQKTSVAIRILDVNDNAPSFENPVLIFNFPELKSPNEKVGRLTAQDLDLSSPNNRYFFSLRRPSSLFELNSESGEIVAMETMRFYGGQTATGTMNDHILDVVVTDLGIPSLSSEAMVIIRVTDANDHRPVFEKDRYFSAVPSNLAVGEDILQVRAIDDKDYGRNAEVTYIISRGNGVAFFAINSTTGLISPKVSLLNELSRKFVLTVTGQDRGNPPQSSQCEVELEITPVNQNSPRFNSNPFVKHVREDAEKGFLVDTITATDNDRGINAEIKFYITKGNADQLFAIGEENGQLTVEGELDYETKKSYTITITARDQGLHAREVSKDFTIELEDVNDNKPVFGQDYYDGYIRENSPGLTSIITLTATDDDTDSQNTQVHYSIVTSAGGGGDSETRSKFQINERTGEISSTANAMFDYEARTQYTLLVMAYNPTTGSATDVLKSVTTVYIHVEGENEHQPQFIRKSYSFTVSESAAAGFSIGEVQASDSDGGVDGIVYYYLEGESNLKGFSVEPTTGVLRVASRPDYEASPTLTLTVIAKNWGPIRGNEIDSCTVTISINDANDPPEFTQQLYLASIPENARGYTLVTFVHAEDKDTRPENREFSYEILSGNDLGKFQVSVSGGKIETTGLGVLDRETMPSYTLVVGARDKTDPTIVGSATVSIQLTDVNDNGPRFSPEDLQVNVPENETAGYEVIVLSDHTTDDDAPPNQGPYRYRLLDSAFSSYFQVELTTGRVTTRRVLNRETNPQFAVRMAVSDHGEPSKTSTLTFTVLVNDINNSQPKPRPLTINLAVLEGADASNMGVIANVQPLDSDLTGIFTCVILSGDTSDFTIRNACDLEALGPLTRDIYNLRVSGSDEKYPPVEYDVTIRVSSLTPGDLASSVAVVLRNEEASGFLESKLDSFKSAVEDAFGSSPFTCYVYGLYQEGADLHVMLYVRDNSNRLLGTADLRRGLTDGRSAIETASGVSIANVAANKCNEASATNGPACLNTGTCSTVVVTATAGGTQIAESASLVMTSPRTELSTTCICPVEFTGPRCEQRQEPCGQTYCDNGQVCGSGNICRCPDNWEGDTCRQVGACLKGTLCENGGTCTLLPSLSFQCQCPTGHHGRYCELSDFCRQAPCSEHSTCEELSDGFQCRCHYGYHGPHCNLLSTSFGAESYASFSPVNNYHVFNVTLYFATVASQGLLLYSPVAVASRGRGSGFVSVEVVDGRAKVSFLLDADNKPITLHTTAIVSNGHWRRLEFTKTLKTATLVLQKCEASVCESCSGRDRSCYHQATFDSGSPQVTGQYLNLGGVSPAQFEADLLPNHAGMVSTHDFVGCMHSVSINGQAFDATPTLTVASTQTVSGVSRPLDAPGVSEGCPRTAAADLCWAGRNSQLVVGDGKMSPDSRVCYNGGTCVDEWTKATCMCPGEYMDDQCLVVKQPFTLGSNTIVKYALNPNYVRDTKLAAAASSPASGLSGRRRRRAALDGTDSARSSVMVRFRATVDQGVLFMSRTEKVTSLLWFSGQRVHFLIKTSDAVNDPLSIPAPSISDGEWHNVTVRASLTSYVLDLDGKTSSSRNFGTAYDFDSLDIVEMAISGEATVPPNNERVPGLDGCLSQFLLNDAPLPLNGSGSDKYIISVQGSVGGGCGALCAGNPCGGDNTCLVEGETYSCLLVAEGDAGLETGIIVVIVFFVIILIIIVAVFVLFRTRRDLFHKCVRTKKQSRGGVGMGSLAGSSAGGSSHSSNGKVSVNIHENIVPGLNGSVNHRYPLNASEEEAIIRNHIAESLSSAAHKSNSLSDRPDLIGGSSGYSTNTPQPLHLSDGTVILEGGGDLMMGGGVGGDEDIPEHYDFENASSIAPSDIAPSDMIRHYRDFRNNHHHHHHKHHHHHHQQPLPPPPLNNHLFNKYRENSPSAHLVPGYRSSPGPGGIPHPAGPGHVHHQLHHTRQSPVSLTGSALSVPAAVPERNHTVGGRPSSAQAAVNLPDGSRSRVSPLTQLNVVRNPRSPHSHRHHQHNYSSNSISPTNQNNNHHHHHHNHHHHDNSRSDSTQSIGSHHSHSSSSSATGVPHHNAPPPSYPHMNPTIQSRPLPPIKAPRGVSNGVLPKGLTVEDVNRLNARPDLTDPVSVMDVVSSSLDNTGRPRAGAHGGPGPKHHLLASHQHHIMAAHDPVLDSSLLLDPPDSSSDDSGANDSFTCSEFEYDNTNNDLAGRIIRDRDPGKLIFSKVTEEVENETDDHQPTLHHPASNQNGGLTIGTHSDGLNSNGDSFTSTNVSSSGSPASQTQEEGGGHLQGSRSPGLGAGIPGSLPSPYDFDTLLNWGPNFDKLVGVFRDIAQLPDSGGERVEGSPDHDYEEYV